MRTPLTDPLQLRARRLGLYGLLSDWAAVANQPWLEEVLQREEAGRKQRSLERRIIASRIGRFKSMADFDYAWPKNLDREQLDELFSLNWVQAATNVILVGLGLHWHGDRRLGERWDEPLQPCLAEQRVVGKLRLQLRIPPGQLHPLPVGDRIEEGAHLRLRQPDRRAHPPGAPPVEQHRPVAGVDVDLRHIFVRQCRRNPGTQVPPHRFGLLFAALEHAGHELLFSRSCDNRERSLVS